MSSNGEVGICNRALLQIGGDTIKSFDDGVVESNLANLMYADLRDAVTQEATWSHARARAGPMARLVEAPPFEYKFQYLLPPECIRVVWAGNDPNGIIPLSKYTVEGRNLLCNLESGLYIKYMRRVSDTSKFPPLFAEALIARLAAEWSIPLTQSKSLKEMHYKIYLQKLEDAESMDGLQGTSEQTITVNAAHARRQGASRVDGFYGWGA